ncbi:MAG: decarboxylase [Gammaproteobacteria bacterium]|nr:decarboxylase [Gammaproteobacteria bacterium]
MKHTLDLRAIAHEMKAAQDEVRQIDPLTSQLDGFDVALAYDVAHLIHEARIDEGAVPVGRKIGFTNPDMWSLYGVREPIWSYVYDTTVVHLSAEGATCNIGRFAEPKIEPEVVVHFRSAPPVGGDLTAFLECIDWLAHGIEIVQSHFPDWKFQVADTVADCALHATLLVGEPKAVERLGTDLLKVLEHFTVALSCDGELREVGRGANVLGSPLAAIAHLTSILANQPHTTAVQPNELVTTGTLTAAFSIHAGETWRTELEGIALPGISVQFVA